MDLNVCLTAVLVATIATDTGHRLRASSTPVLLMSSNSPTPRFLSRSPEGQGNHDWPGQSLQDDRLEAIPKHRQTDSPVVVIPASGSTIGLHSSPTSDWKRPSEKRKERKHAKSPTLADRSGSLSLRWNLGQHHGRSKRRAGFRPEGQRQVGDGEFRPAGSIRKRSGGAEVGSSINPGSGVLPADPRGDQRSGDHEGRTEDSETRAQHGGSRVGSDVNEGGEEGGVRGLHRDEEQGVQGLHRRRDAGDSDVAEPALVHEERDERENDRGGSSSSVERRPSATGQTSASPHARTTVLSGGDASAIANNDLPPVLNHFARSMEPTASQAADPVMMSAEESGHEATRATTRGRLAEAMGTAAPPVVHGVETPAPSASASHSLITGSAAVASSLTTSLRQGVHDHSLGAVRGHEGKDDAAAEGDIDRPFMPYNPVVRPTAAATTTLSLSSVSQRTRPTATTPEMTPATTPSQNRSVQVDHPPRGLDLESTSTRHLPVQTALPAATTSAADMNRSRDAEVSEAISARPSLRNSTTGSRDGRRDGESNNASSLTTAAAQPIHVIEPAVPRSEAPTIDRPAVIPLHDPNTTLLVPTLSVSRTSFQNTAPTVVRRDTTLSVTSTLPPRTASSFLPNPTANAQRASVNNTGPNFPSPSTTIRHATIKPDEKTEPETQSVSNTTAFANSNVSSTPTTGRPAVSSTFGARITTVPARGNFSAGSPETPRASVSHHLTALYTTPLSRNTITPVVVIDGNSDDGKKSSEGADHRHGLETTPGTPTPRTTEGEGFAPLPSTTSSVSMSSCTHAADVRLTGPLYIEIKLQMTWRQFCSHLNIFRLELVDIVRQSTQQESFAVDQICLLESPRKACALRPSASGPELFEEEQIEIQLYLVNKTKHYDVMLTYNCAKALKQGFQALETSMFKDKLILVRLQELTEQDPLDALSPSTASGEAKGDYSFLNVPGVTIVISIASVGGVCCAALIVIQVVLRRRYREGVRVFNRNYSVASADSIALNSVTRSRPNSGLFNPGLDVAAEKLPKPVSHLLNFTQLTRFVSDLTGIYEEFQRIPNKTPRLSVVPVGAEDRNRFANILPIPSTRVVLNSKDAEDSVATYINANYVSGYNGRQRTYIATQAPLEKTVPDFWLMVWQHETKAVIMLLNPVEDGQKKCGMYFPESAGQEYAVTCGDFVVTMTKRDVHQEYITSWLQLKMIKTRETRAVRHFWLTCWPLGGRPEPISLVRFVLDTRPLYEDYTVPLVVHCSNGTARTGTLIALDICMRQFEDRRTVDVMSCVDVLRHERAGCVQTSEQYAILYQAVNEYAKILSSPRLSATSSSLTLATSSALTLATGTEGVAPS